MEEPRGKPKTGHNASLKTIDMLEPGISPCPYVITGGRGRDKEWLCLWQDATKHMHVNVFILLLSVTCVMSEK